MNARIKKMAERHAKEIAKIVCEGEVTLDGFNKVYNETKENALQEFIQS